MSPDDLLSGANIELLDPDGLHITDYDSWSNGDHASAELHFYGVYSGSYLWHVCQKLSTRVLLQYASGRAGVFTAVKRVGSSRRSVFSLFLSRCIYILNIR